MHCDRRDRSGPRTGDCPDHKSTTDSQNHGIVNQRGMSTRFQPKSHASIDHPPGPRRASAAPIAASRMQGHGSLLCVSALQSPTINTREPAIGVHNPAIRRTPIPIKKASRIAARIGMSAWNPSISWTMREIPATTRNSKSPAPGQPRAKVENRRRTQTPWRSYAIVFPVRNPRK